MTGSVVVQKRARVEEKDDRHTWVKLLEGEKKGLYFAVPDNECMAPLRVGDEGMATFESLNEKRTAWEITDWQGNER